jgi:hypothetical protein
MVESGASSNVMPLSFCQKINAEVQPSSLKIIQLDRMNIKVIGELKDVLVRLSFNLKVKKIIDIILVDILEFYGFFLVGIDPIIYMGTLPQIGHICGYQKMGIQIKLE